MANLFNYSTQGIWAGSAVPASWNFESIAASPLNGVQSSQITMAYPRQDIPDWAGGGSPVIIQRPRATLDFTYIFSNGVNEQSLGFALSTFTPALANLNGERNYYVFIDLVNQDLIGYGGTNSYVMAFGNGLITKYDFRAAVGQPSVVSVSVDALNLLIQGSGSGNPIPYVNKQSGTFATGQYSFPAFSQNVQHYFEAAPSNIVLSFDTGSAIGAVLSGNVSCPLQSFDFSVDMARVPAQNLGWAYPDTRAIRWPVTISISATAYLNGLQADALNRFGCPDSGWSFSVGFISGGGLMDPFFFQFLNAKLDSEVMNASIGEYNKVSFNWTCKVYDINRTSGDAANLFFSYPQIAYESIIFNGVNWGTGISQTPLVMNLSEESYLSIAAGAAILNKNVVTMLNEPGSVTIQLNVSGSSEVDLVTATIQ